MATCEHSDPAALSADELEAEVATLASHSGRSSDARPAVARFRGTAAG